VSKTTELIDEIAAQRQAIQRLTEELKEKYRVLGALLLSARALVPQERWEAWLQANLSLDVPSVETVIEAGMSKSDWDFLGLQQPKNNLLEHKGETPATMKDNGYVREKNRKTLKIR